MNLDGIASLDRRAFGDRKWDRLSIAKQNSIRKDNRRRNSMYGLVMQVRKWFEATAVEGDGMKLTNGDVQSMIAQKNDRILRVFR